MNQMTGARGDGRALVFIYFNAGLKRGRGSGHSARHAFRPLFPTPACCRKTCCRSTGGYRPHDLHLACPRCARFTAVQYTKVLQCSWRVSAWRRPTFRAWTGRTACQVGVQECAPSPPPAGSVLLAKALANGAASAQRLRAPPSAVAIRTAVM